MEEFNTKAKEQEDLGKKIQAPFSNAKNDSIKKNKTGGPKRQNNSKSIGTKFNEIMKNLTSTLRKIHKYFEVKNASINWKRCTKIQRNTSNQFN